MKLSYRSYPVLLLANDEEVRKMQTMKAQMGCPIMGSFDSEQERKALEYGEHLLLGEKIMVGKRIYYVKKDFMDAASRNTESFSKMIEKDSDAFLECNESCVLITFGGYVIVNHVVSRNERIFLVLNSKCEFIHLAKIHFNEQTNKNDIKVWFTMYKDDIIPFIQETNILLTFKKYAPIEVVVVGANSRKKTNVADNGKVINETGLEVTLLDSKWFREIVRNEGFLVRGHFRLQPCKDETGKWTRKLIYINEFEKHGYHRRALIETSNS